jgi:MFS family permease
VAAAAAHGHASGATSRVALLLFAVSFGTNVPTPLLVLYRHRLGLSPTAVTSIFAVYAVGLLLALFTVGPASDRLGRRAVVLPFAALAVVTSLLFIPAAHLEPLLFVGRFAQGVVSGAVFSVGSAWLAEVSPTAPPSVSARRASMSLNAGFAIGPLTAGILGQWGPAPTVLPFLLHVGLAGTGLLLASRAPETVAVRRAGAVVRVRIPAEIRRPFWTVLVPTAALVFAFPATAATVLPFLLDPSAPAVAVTGLIAGLTLGTAALVAPVARPLDRRAAPLGLVCGAVGLGLAVTSTHLHGWPVMVPISVLLGIGSGLTMTAGLTVAERLATEATRGSVYALLYAFAYAGFGVPVLVTVTAGESVAVPFLLLVVLSLSLAAWLTVAARRGAALAAGRGAHVTSSEPIPGE